MSRRPVCRAWRGTQLGVSLITGIVMLLLLSGIAVYMLRLSSVQHATSAADVMGTRAYYAARSGLEWGAYQALNGSLAGGYCNGGVTSTTITGMAGELAAFNVAVACSRSDHNEAGTTVRMYTLTATACNESICPSSAPGANYVERQMTVVVSR